MPGIDKTKLLKGPIEVILGDDSDITISPVPEVQLRVTANESEETLSDGSGDTHVTGRKVELIVPLDEFDPAGADAAEALKGEKVTLEFLDVSAPNSLVTIDDVDQIVVDLEGTRQQIKITKYGHAASTLASLLTVGAPPA